MSLKVYDTNLVSEEMFAEVVHLPYYYTRVDVPPTESQPELDLAGMYWTHQFYNYCPVDDPKEFDSPGLHGSDNKLWTDVLTYLEAVCPDMPPRDECYASYINVLKYNDSPGIHCDAPYHVDDQCTVLVYLNAEWRPDWGGETIFYDDQLEAKRIVTPKPGRIVIFDGRIPHTGRPPTPKYMFNRYILAFKYMNKDTRHKLFVDHEINNMPPVEDRGIAGLNVETVKKIWQSMDTRS